MITHNIIIIMNISAIRYPKILYTDALNYKLNITVVHIIKLQFKKTVTKGLRKEI